MFDPPHGLYLLAYDEQERPVATGGWRTQDRNPEGYEDGDAEIKADVRDPRGPRPGLARRMLAALEEDARAAGRVRMVLETGDQQPEAVALYTSCGYTVCEVKFGHYRTYDSSICMAKPLRQP